MNLWNILSSRFSSESKQYTSLYLPSKRLYPAIDANPIQVGDAYCRLWLIEMRLAKGVEAFHSRYPVVHTATRFHYGDQTITVPYIAGPGYFQQFDNKHNLDKVIQGNQLISPLFPIVSSQDTIKLQAGLFSMVANDPIRSFIAAVGRFSEALPIPELSSVVKQIGPLYSGIEDLLNLKDCRLELGYEYEFAMSGGSGNNMLKSGYFAVIRAEENQIDQDDLCVVKDSLRLSARRDQAFSQDNYSLDGYSYMLFYLEVLKEQDWGALTDIKVLVRQAQEAVLREKNDLVKDLLLPNINVAIYKSDDIAKNDKPRMACKIASELKALGLHSTQWSSLRSLHSIMQQPLLFETDNAMEATLTLLEELYRK